MFLRLYLRHVLCPIVELDWGDIPHHWLARDWSSEGGLVAATVRLLDKNLCLWSLTLVPCGLCRYDGAQSSSW